MSFRMPILHLRRFFLGRQPSGQDRRESAAFNPTAFTSHDRLLERIALEFFNKNLTGLIYETLWFYSCLQQKKEIPLSRLWALQNRLIQIERNSTQKHQPPHRTIKQELSYKEFQAQLQLFDYDLKIILDQLKSYLIELINTIDEKVGWYLFLEEKLSVFETNTDLNKSLILPFEQHAARSRSLEQLGKDVFFIKNILGTQTELTASNLSSLEQFLQHLFEKLDMPDSLNRLNIYDKLTHALYLIDERVTLGA